MNKINLFLVFFSLLSVSLLAQEDFRKTAPKAGPAPKIQLGTYEQFELQNGLKVILVENHKTPSVSFQVFIDVPPILEGEVAGTASMAGELLSKGTTTKSKAQIDEEVDFIGANMASSASGVRGASLTKHQDKLLTLMADVLLHPSFPEAEFEKLKKQTLSNLASEKDDPNAILGNVQDVLCYGSAHPYGELMTEQSVEKITLDECKKFYETYFKPNISYLVIVGDIKKDAAKNAAEKYFGSWKTGEVPKTEVPAVAFPGETTVDFVAKTGAVQSVLAITYPVDLKPGSDDAIKARVMNTLFGGYFRSRLNNNIREDKGYSYGVRSTLSSDRHVGYFSAGGSVRNEVTDSSIIEFLKEMKTLTEQKVPVEELTLVKNVLSGSFARQLERPETVARFALNTARYNLPKDYYATYLEKISAVSPDDILAMAKKYLKPEQARILVVGNKEEVADNLSGLAANGKVNFYDFYGVPAADAVAIPEGVTAESVIADYVEAIGGADKVKAVKEMKTVASTSLQGMAMEMTTYQKDGKMALKGTAGGMVFMQQKFDGEKGVQMQMGQKEMLEGEALEGMQRAAILFPEAKLSEIGGSLELTGIEVINGKQAYKVVITYSSGSKVVDFYDMESALKLRSMSEEEGATVMYDILGYTEVEGIMVPSGISISGVMPVPMQMKTESVEINKSIDDSVFVIE